MTNQSALVLALTAAAAWLIGLLLGRVFIPMLRAMKAGQSIREVGPSWHSAKAGTPTMGGIIFIAATALACVLAGVLGRAERHDYLYVLGFSAVYGLIGFADDFVKVKMKRNLGLTALQKLALQLAAAACYLLLLRWSGHMTRDLYIPFWNVTCRVSWPLYLILAVFVIVGCVNAVNLTDGIDGLAAGVTMPVMLFFTMAAALWKHTTLGLFPAALFGGLAAFLAYNFHPAKVFMGDTGSLFLGAAVCGTAFALDMPLILVPVGIVYIIETLSVILQVTYFKLTHGRRIFKMTPIHHHFEMCGWSEVKIFTVFTLVTLAGCIAAWFGILGRY